MRLSRRPCLQANLIRHHGMRLERKGMKQGLMQQQVTMPHMRWAQRKRPHQNPASGKRVRYEQENEVVHMQRIVPIPLSRALCRLALAVR